MINQAYGLEILCANAVKAGVPKTAADVVSDDDGSWDRFVQSLHKLNYFQV